MAHDFESPLIGDIRVRNQQNGSTEAFNGVKYDSDKLGAHWLPKQLKQLFSSNEPNDSWSDFNKQLSSLLQNDWDLLRKEGFEQEFLIVFELLMSWSPRTVTLVRDSHPQKKTQFDTLAINCTESTLTHLSHWPPCNRIISSQMLLARPARSSL